MTFSIATEKLTSIKELCDELSKVVDFSLSIEFEDPKAFADRDQPPLNIKLSEEILDWKPQTSLSEGLKKTIDWVKINNNLK